MASKKEIFLENVIKAGGQGYSKERAIKEIPSTTSGVFSMAHVLRKEGHLLNQENGVYVYGGKKAGSTARPYNQGKVTKALPVPVEASAGTGTVSNIGRDTDFLKTLASKQTLKELANLSKSELEDYLEMIKKSVFYRISSDAVIRASRFTEELRRELTAL